MTSTTETTETKNIIPRTDFMSITDITTILTQLVSPPTNITNNKYDQKPKTLTTNITNNQYH